MKTLWILAWTTLCLNSFASDVHIKPNFTLTDSLIERACPEIYRPVCGRPELVCNDAGRCATPTPVTYSNPCELRNAGAMRLYAGECGEAMSSLTEMPLYKQILFGI